MTDQSNKLKLVTQAEEFFRELVLEAMSRQNIKARGETEVYLVNLLQQFMQTDRLYPRDADGNYKEEPLALMIKEAMEQPDVSSQRSLYRQVGDVSLYMAGFFQDSLNRKIVDVDYYIGMGGSAYKHVAARADENTMRAIFQELAEKFSRFVDVLAAVSDQTAIKSEVNLIRMYELWTRTRSERAAKALQDAGILPVAPGNNKKNWQ